MRISIIGMPGSGKSTLARAISHNLLIPHIHLDKYWFESGGRTGERDTPNIEDVRTKVRSRVVEAINLDAWVSDGFHSQVQPLITERADVVILLDIPLWWRLFGHAKRMLRRKTRHKELGVWDDFKFFGEIIKRNISRKYEYIEFKKKYASKIVLLHSWKEADDYLNQLRHP